MTTPQIYILILIIILAIIAVILFFVNKNKKDKKLTPLAGLAFGFILVGILFGADRIAGYSLMGVGIILAIIDIIKKTKSKKNL
jgi:hypothetical protein